MRILVTTISVAAVLTADIGNVTGATLQPAQGIQTRFAFASDPDILYFHPGNDGVMIFGEAESDHPGNVQPWQDVYADSRQLELDSKDYLTRLSSPDPNVQSLYWQRMNDYMRGATMRGELPAWIINDDFVNEWTRNPALVDAVSTQGLEMEKLQYNVPAIVFKVSDWAGDTERLYRELRTRLAGWQIGAYVDPQNYLSTLSRRWSFVIAEEEVIPETYRGQAAVRWLHGQYGEVPVILSPAQPIFFRDISWAVSGAAGLWYRPLPAAATEDNGVAATHLRASTTYLNRFGSDPITLRSRPPGNAFLFAMDIGGGGWAAGLKAATTETEVFTPANMVGKTVAGVWFNPATDENVLEPLTTATEQLKLKPPSSSAWLYSRTVSPQLADTATTVSAIKPWED